MEILCKYFQGKLRRPEAEPADEDMPRYVRSRKLYRLRKVKERNTGVRTDNDKKTCNELHADDAAELYSE